MNERSFDSEDAAGPDESGQGSDHDPLVSLRDVKVHFPLARKSGWPWSPKIHVKAVDGVDMDIFADEIFGLAGESGCGKSTIARVVLDLIHRTSGSILFHGRPVEDYTNHELRPRIQMVFQDPYTSLNPRRNVGSIVSDPLVVHTKLGSAERRRRVMEMLEHVGLARDHYYRYPHEFSGGQRQRIAIARALILKPEFLVLDEPTSALDVSVQAVILNLIKQIKEEFRLGCLFITHDLNLLRFLTDRLAVMYLGRIVEMGRTRDLFETPLHPYSRALIASTPQPEPERERDYYDLEGELPSNINPPSGCPFHTRCPEKISGVCDAVAPELRPFEGRMVACHLYHQPAGLAQGVQAAAATAPNRDGSNAAAPGE